MITLTLLSTSQTLQLSERLLWTDEFAWSPTAAEARFGTTGALMVHVGKKQSGRLITLDGVESEAWLTRGVVAQINAWAALPGARFLLRLRGIDRTVLFDHARAPAFNAQPVIKLQDGVEQPTDLYRPTFNFIEV